MGSYLDGHLAITPLGFTEKPWGESCPEMTTSEPSWKVSGTMPVYSASITAPLFSTLNRYSRVFGLTSRDPGTT